MVEFTGERVIPGEVNRDLWNEHVARYAFAAPMCAGKKVLDLGTGTGYGAAKLAEFAEAITALDFSTSAVAFAKSGFPKQRLELVQAAATQIPFRDRTFDVVVAFELIEHLSDWASMLREAYRVLKPEGRLLVSTPNKLYYAESRGVSGANPYHKHEFEFLEFRDELAKVFPSVSIFVQNHSAGFLFQPLEPDGGSRIEIEDAGSAPERSNFFVAICALQAQPQEPTFVYLPTAANLLRERELHIRKLEDEVQTKSTWLEKLTSEHQKIVELFRCQTVELEERNRWAAELDGKLKQAGERIVALQDELAGITGRYEAVLAQINTTLEQKCQELAQCVDFLHETEKTVEERTVWARKLDSQLSAVERQLNFVRASRWFRLGRKLGLGPALEA